MRRPRWMLKFTINRQRLHPWRCRSKLDVEENSAKEVESLKEQIALLSESSSSALEEVATLREQKAADEESHAASTAQKDEVISTLKSKLEEVMAAYKRLKGHLQELQERLTQQTTTYDSLKASYDELNAQHAASVEELEMLKTEASSSRERADALVEELRQAQEKFAESEAQRESQMENFKKRVLAFNDELTQKQRQNEVALHELRQSLLMEFSARDEAAQLKLSELEESCTLQTKTVEKKELEIQSLAERVRLLQEEHAQAGSDREETDRKHEAERMELEAQLSSANETIEKLRSATDANVGLQRETISQLENQAAKLVLQVESETEGANAARAALETYKKRAHTALKKASSENKLNLKKAAQSTTKLEQELVSAKGRISTLETELEESRKRMAELESAGDALAQSAREALEAEKRSQEASLRLEIDSLKAEVVRLEMALASQKTPLEAQIKQLSERNEALNHEISALRESIRTQNESLEEAVHAKEEEISELSKQLQAALAAAASLATNEAGRRSYSPASSPTEKERRSTASSSRSFDSEGNNSFLHQTTIEEQHEHIAAAVADSCPIPLASKANGVDQQAKAPADASELVRLKLALHELENQSHVFQKKVRRVFSPQEHQKVMAAHSKANDEGSGLFGGVFSLFGGGAASPPPPKPLAAPPNFKPSPTTAKTNTTGAALGSKDKNGVLSFGSDPSDDEEFATPLNPFAT
ncbi:unnamed protein product [Phytophthora lilii]|uniref:Unnamed protein product n=1 Tax=Phytophthora lilii TaxID=2077276 RepID=A0A9W6XKQ1_9STRA|nr:unnamed protein product [Phytophthora lilii]